MLSFCSKKCSTENAVFATLGTVVLAAVIATVVVVVTVSQEPIDEPKM